MAPARTVPVVWFDPARPPEVSDAGDEVVVLGQGAPALLSSRRRRTQSRTEVLARGTRGRSGTAPERGDRGGSEAGQERCATSESFG